MPTNVQLPFYAKFTLIAIGLFLFIFTLFVGQQIIVPLIFAFILAILLNPFVNFLLRRKINRIISISIAVLTALLVIAGLVYFLSVQITLFGETYPILKVRFEGGSKDFIQWVSKSFNIRPIKIHEWIASTQQDAIKNLGGSIGQTLSTLNSVLIIAFLLPVYLFMILYYKSLLLEFIRRLFKSNDHDTVFEVLTNSKKIIQSYLTGLMVEAVIIAVLNCAALLLLGIDYAIILGITGALLNVIPYIGGVIAIALPMIIAFVTKDSASSAILVFVVYLIIQFIDNHFIIPRIVASRVKINALISVVAVIVGGALWGVPGMFLSIPLTAIVKVIFDHIEPLKPWGFLLGNITPTTKLSFGEIIRKPLKRI
jgi:predicted PurR-regulated permease PerM